MTKDVSVQFKSYMHMLTLFSVRLGVNLTSFEISLFPRRLVESGCDDVHLALRLPAFQWVLRGGLRMGFRRCM